MSIELYEQAEYKLHYFLEKIDSLNKVIYFSEDEEEAEEYNELG